MNTRPLTKTESANLACINRAGKESSLLFITGTILEKSIADATEPLRLLFRKYSVHNYDAQGQGPENKRLLDARIHVGGRMIGTSASVYRPKTKAGDPRIWFYNFRSYTRANDVCAVFIHGCIVHVVNLTTSKLAHDVGRGFATPETAFFTELARGASAVAHELLEKLQAIASRGLVEAVCSGDTAVGRSLEAALGVRINSSKEPDYLGIELKSGRAGITSRENRANLFACVPDWNLSRCKSSKQILDEFGYPRGEQFKLYCTVSAKAENSQGLIFDIQTAERWLRERCVKAPTREVAVWRLERLEHALSAKHRETFWIKADSVWRGDKEFFRLKSITHTRDPNVPQLERMLLDGTVTMDHLIKRKANGGASEKGPLFKIIRSRIPELFLGEPKIYKLN